MKANLSAWFAPVLGAALLAAGLFIAPGAITGGAPRSASPGGANQVVNPTTTPSSPPPAGPMRTVTVSGSGKIDATPDIAIIDLGVTTQAQTARAALTQNNQQMQALLNALKTAGVAPADIRTLNVEIMPNYQQPPPDQTGAQAAPKVVGYTANNTVEVTVRDLSKLGDLLDSAVSAGSNILGGIRFDVSDPQKVMDQAREAAMKDATHKAGQLASLANATLGPVVSIDESSQRPIPFAAGAMSAAPAAQPVPVQPGTQTIVVDVQVTWELQVKP